MTQDTSGTLTDASSPRRSFLSGSGRLFLVGIVLLLALAYLIYAAFPGSTSYYFTVDELAAFDGEVEGRSFRVKGALVPDTFVREEGGTMATFALTAGDQILPATYDGVVPDLFFNTYSEIILQGTFGGRETFQVDTVSVLCPTKYQSLEEVTT